MSEPTEQRTEEPRMYVWVTTFDGKTFGVWATEKLAHRSLDQRIGPGPKRDRCEVTRWPVLGLER